MKAIKSAILCFVGIIGVILSMFGIKMPFAESLAKEHWKAGATSLINSAVCGEL